MARPDKVAAVAELAEKFTTSTATVLTEYRGLRVKDLKALRRSLAESASYAVAKNTLAKIAAKDAGIEGLDDVLVGPTAFTFINGDVATVAKALRDFAKANPLLIIKGGVMDGRVLDANAVKSLADLESREVLLSKLAGGLKATQSKAAGVFAALPTQAAQLFGALQEKLAAGAPVEADQKPEQAEDAVAEAADAAPAEAVEADAPAAEVAEVAEATTPEADVASTSTDEAAE
ncbi:MAG: 50S ribosomal protein L10 [Propionibacteriaceae bacterium]|jgi:large subunit ribosomal protein L10|nr:50S ribosomal protein L10 [Propionibacteriaceae bacterium]